MADDHNLRATDSVSAELDAIRGLIASNATASEARYNLMLAMVREYMDRIDAFMHETPCPHLKSAIPNDDFKGHGDYHAGLVEWDNRVKDLKWHIIKVVIGVGSTGFLAWLGVLIWTGVIIGPRA